MREFTFTIMGRIPSKKNQKNIVRVAGHTILVSNKKYQRWELDAKDALGIQKMTLGTNNFPIVQSAITIEVTFPDMIRRDLTNVAEGLMDALVLAGIIPDDCWKFVPVLMLRAMGADKKDARAVIRIQEIGKLEQEVA